MGKSLTSVLDGIVGTLFGHGSSKAAAPSAPSISNTISAGIAKPNVLTQLGVNTPSTSIGAGPKVI